MKDSNFIWRLLGITRMLYNQKRNASLIENLEKTQREVYYANLFNDSIKGSEWFIHKSISPSGWALNYASIYFLYRVLDKMRPKNILEFGLGQSSKLIYQYVNFFKGTSAITYEHDTEWIDFFMNEKDSSYDINIHLAEVKSTIYKQNATVSYKDNCAELKGQKFDMILVDGPNGSEHYSRSQILNIVPDCLMSSFCIMIHDSERCGEKETISELLNIMDKHDVKYCTNTISSNKDMFVVCSEDLKFLNTI